MNKHQNKKNGSSKNLLLTTSNFQDFNRNKFTAVTEKYTWYSI